MSIKQSVFEEIVIESNDKSRRVDIALGSVMIDYYEDIFSPTITAKRRVVNKVYYPCWWCHNEHIADHAEFDMIPRDDEDTCRSKQNSKYPIKPN